MKLRSELPGYTLLEEDVGIEKAPSKVGQEGVVFCQPVSSTPQRCTSLPVRDAPEHVQNLRCCLAPSSEDSCPTVTAKVCAVGCLSGAAGSLVGAAVGAGVGASFGAFGYPDFCWLGGALCMGGLSMGAGVAVMGAEACARGDDSWHTDHAQEDRTSLERTSSGDKS